MSLNFGHFIRIYSMKFVLGKIRKPAAPSAGERLTEREYLAIGICSGFLLMLYLFAMVVFLLIRRRHRRDKRLREQFLNLPLPQGLGYKSSRILGLDDSFNPYFGNGMGGGEGKLRLSTRSSGHCSIHSTKPAEHEHIYDITKVICIRIYMIIRSESELISMCIVLGKINAKTLPPAPVQKKKTLSTQIFCFSLTFLDKEV